MITGKNTDEQKGITLIALVITIIVLLILAGIAISMLSGENGILKKAANSKTETEKQVEKENIKLAIAAAMTNKDHELDNNILGKELNKYFKNVEVIEKDGFVIEVDGKIYTIDKNGILDENNYNKKQENSKIGSVTLKNSAGKSISSLKIEGNSVQEGTPSPTNPKEINSVGDLVTEGEYKGKYKIPIKVSGKNLFDINDFETIRYTNQPDKNISIDNDGVISFPHWYAKDSGHAISIPVNYGETITFSWENVADVYCTSIYLYNTADVDENGIVDVSKLKRLTDLYNSPTTQTVTVLEGYNRIAFAVGSPTNTNRYNAKIKNLQIEKSATPTTYEPYIEPITKNIYLDEPLRKVGNYADYIDFDKGVIVRNTALGQITKAGFIHSKVADTDKYKGHCCMTTGGTIVPLKNTPMLAVGFPNATNRWSSKIESIFSHSSLDGYIYLKVNWDRMGLVYDGTKVYVNSDETQTALTDNEIVTYFTRYINTLTKKEKEFICVRSRLEKEIELPTIPTHKGTNIITIDTEIKPSNIDLTYLVKNN